MHALELAIIYCHTSSRDSGDSYHQQCVVVTRDQVASLLLTVCIYHLSRRHNNQFVSRSAASMPGTMKGRSWAGINKGAAEAVIRKESCKETE